MTGTAGDIVAIVIVPILVLAFWLGMMFYVTSHPEWRSQARADTSAAHALDGSVPAQCPSSPGRVVPGQRPGAAADKVAPEQARVSARQG
jgi:hypothetical protein